MSRASADLEQAEVDLAAVWVFDPKSQDKSWNTTFGNERAYMLKADRRSQSLLEQGRTDEQVSEYQRQ